MILALTLVLTPAVAAADRDRMNDLGEQLMCLCGCGQLLIKCSHLNCPKSVPMLKELAAHLETDETNQQIMAAFTEKYGNAVKSNGGGLGVVAKTVAFLVLLAGGLVAVAVVRKWKRESAPALQLADSAAAAAPVDPNYRRRIEEDLNKLTPED